MQTLSRHFLTSAIQYKGTDGFYKHTAPPRPGEQVRWSSMVREVLETRPGVAPTQRSYQQEYDRLRKSGWKLIDKLSHPDKLVKASLMQHEDWKVLAILCPNGDLLKIEGKRLRIDYLYGWFSPAQKEAEAKKLARKNGEPMPLSADQLEALKATLTKALKAHAKTAGTRFAK